MGGGPRSLLWRLAELPDGTTSGGARELYDELKRAARRSCTRRSETTSEVSKDDPYDQPEVTIERNRARFGTFSWQGQAPQYDQLGPPGEIVYRRYFDGRPLIGEGKATIDTLLHYDERGHLDGILNTYPYGAAETPTAPSWMTRAMSPSPSVPTRTPPMGVCAAC